MRTARYIEVDAAWWGETSHTPPEPGPLFDALSNDGWKTVKESERRRRFCRRFGSTSEYQAALASARFKAAEHLAERRHVAS